MQEMQPVATLREDYLPPSHWIEQTDLRFELDDAATLVRSSLQVRRNPQADGDTRLRLDGAELELLEVAIDGRRLSNNEYSVDAAGLAST